MTVSKSSKAKLLYADSDKNADMFYFGKVAVPDPFAAIEIGGEKVCAVSQLEYSRVQKEGIFDTVLPLEELISEMRASGQNWQSVPQGVITLLAKKYNTSEFLIPNDFPAGLAFQLQDSGLELEAVTGMLFPEREFKSAEEAALIREGNKASEAGFKVFESILKKSIIGRGNKLKYNGRILTSEFLQEAIAIACLQKGAVSENTIVAGGDQACDPHCRGNGPLKAGELIIVDIFPRVAKTGYHGDMTRTYIKGTPTDAQGDLVTTVLSAEQAAISEHRARKSAKKIYQSVVSFFESKGYKTEKKDGVPQGFIHGLGHGLGLEVHEPPRVNPLGDKLRSGQVITVEPGLYYPGVGGARMEDVVWVRNGEPELLSNWKYNWKIK